MQRRKLHAILTGFALAASISQASLASAAVLTIDTTGPKDILLGATGVDVGGTLYDATFVDGLYADLNADGLLDIVFTTSAAATVASQALIDQVIRATNYTANVNFDTEPEFISGCTDAALCELATPFSDASGSGPVLHIAALNQRDTLADFTQAESFTFLPDTTDRLGAVYVNWSLAASSAAPVPEPSTYAMMALGLLGIAGMRRRQNQA